MKILTKILDTTMKGIQIGVAMLYGAGKIIKSGIEGDKDSLRTGVYFFLGGLGRDIIALCAIYKRSGVI